MLNTFEPKHALSSIDLPTQDIDFLVFCSSHKLSDVEQWAHQLKSTQVSQTSAALYRAIPQVLRLICDVKCRFKMLEVLMPHVHHAIYGLAKQFLNQPIVLPEGLQKAAIIAQALQKNMLDGYILCIRNIINEGKLKEATKETLVTSIQRALDSASSLILRSAQLHSPVPKSVWLKIHTLYMTAEYYDLLGGKNAIVSDNYNSRNIHDAYIRSLTMGCSNLNQVTQKDVFVLYKALNSWARFISLSHDIDLESTQGHVVNVQTDKAPIRKDRVHSDTAGHYMEISFSKLVQSLNAQSNDNGDAMGLPKSVKIPVDMSESLLSHLFDSWSKSHTRQHQRRSSKHTAEVCIGLSECHTLLCGNVGFDSFLSERKNSTDAAPSALAGLEGFDSIFSNRLQETPVIATKDDTPKYVKALVKDLSKEGYRLSWECTDNCRIEAGDIMTIREQGRRSWGLGVIRWIRRHKNSCMIGVKLLSNRPQPYAAAIMYDEGGFSDFMRAFYLPESTQPRQPASIVTASVPFKEGARVKLKQDERIVNARLDRSIVSTSKIQQFDYRATSEESDPDT